MDSYYFILGRENKISQKELECVLASFDFGLNNESISILTDQILEIKLVSAPGKIADLMNVLGGTVKIFQKIALADEKIDTLLSEEDLSKKLTFGLSNYRSEKMDTFRMALQAKKTLKKSIRIIDGKEDGKLSSAQSFQYKMDCGNIEYGLFSTGIGRLVAVQNINEWARHDYGKPRSDARSGMLPPKLARIMVNLATGFSDVKNPLVVDPFCGSGNVLMEALTIGYEIIGSDFSQKAVDDTTANLVWLSKGSKFDISRQDAVKFDFSKISRDFVVATEPFLGQPRRSKLRIEEEKQAKTEIVKLYYDFLKNLSDSSGKLQSACIVFPLFELANGKKLSIFEECVDFIHEFGYTIICPPLDYGRDYQIVKRQIALLKLSAVI